MRPLLRFAAATAALSALFAQSRPEFPADYLDNRSVDVARIAPDKCTVELLNERMRVLRMRVPAKTRVPIHQHGPGLVVAVKELALRIASSDGTITDVLLHASETQWIPGGVHSEENLGAAAAEYLYIEAKN